MSVDNTIEQLLARAILDLELKMKHEIRQNSALHLARIEKHNQQLEKRLDIIEAKLEALINRDSQAHAPRNSMQHFSGGGRHSLHTSTTGRVSYYPRSPNLANGHPHHVGGARPTSKRLSTMGNPASTIGYGSGWGPNSAPSSAVRAVGGIQQQHKHAYERKQYQSKQPLGTGGNRASLGEKSANKTPWPNRGGNFTDDVTDASEDDNSSQTGSESPYSVAKPACKPEDDCINKDCEEEDDNDGNEEKFEKLSSKEQGETDDDADDDNASAKMNGGSNDDFDEKENYNNEDNNIVETSVVVTSTIVTPGAMISPVSGGFGRSRRN